MEGPLWWFPDWKGTLEDKVLLFFLFCWKGSPEATFLRFLWYRGIQGETSKALFMSYVREVRWPEMLVIYCAN